MCVVCLPLTKVLLNLRGRHRTSVFLLSILIVCQLEFFIESVTHFTISGFFCLPQWSCSCADSYFSFLKSLLDVCLWRKSSPLSFTFVIWIHKVLWLVLFFALVKFLYVAYVADYSFLLDYCLGNVSLKVCNM